MSSWSLLHGGALGDLVLTLQLALRLPGITADARRGARPLRLLSRVNPGDLSGCKPSIEHISAETVGLHWLYGDHDDPPPQRLAELVAGRRVLSALGGTHTITHQRLLDLDATAVYSLDPRPRTNLQRHITDQWQTQLEAQGLLVPKCVHQRPTHRGLGVPEALRQRGRVLLEHADSVVIHPGGGGRRKCWPLASFLAVARLLRANTRLQPCFLVGPVELDTWKPPELEALAGQFPLLRHPAPDDLVAVLAAARAFIGNDAGPSHLAALLGTPTIVVFGATAANTWRPLGPQVQVIAGEMTPDPRNWGIRPEQVIECPALSGCGPR